jgi:hypothetical protein
VSAGDPVRDGLRSLAAVAALGLLVALAYSNSFSAGFTLDSRFVILEDPRVHRATAENVGLVLTHDYWWPKAVSGLYRPLTTLSYLANYALFGNADRPAGYHVVNLLLHWANASLAFLLVRSLTGAVWPAFAAAALFAVHPIDTEAVTNLVGRADLLAALSVLAGTLLYVRAAQHSGRPRLAYLLGLTATTALGVFCKESAVAVVGVVVLYELVYRLEPGPWRTLLGRLRALDPSGLVALAPALVVLGVARRRLFSGVEVLDIPFMDNPLVGASFWTARATAVKVLGRSLALLAWPWTLSCDYSYTQIPLVDWSLRGWEDWQAPLAVGLVAGVVWAAVHGRGRHPCASFFALLCLVTLLPTANLLLLVGTVLAERLLYLPAVGFTACVVLVAGALSRRAPRLAASLLVVLIAAAAARTHARNADWRDDVTLWTSAVQAVPRSARAHERLAYALAEHQGPGADHMPQILSEGEAALSILDASPLPPADVPTTVPLELGVYYQAKGSMVARAAADERAPEALGWYRRAADVLERAAVVDRAKNARHHERVRGDVADVGNYEVYERLGATRLLLAEPDLAHAAFVTMRHLAPANPAAHLGVARAELARDRPTDAAVALVQALALDPRRQEPRRLLADVYARLDPGGCALVAADGPLRLDPSCPRVQADLCRAYEGLFVLHLDAKQAALADRFAERAVSDYGCPADGFRRTGAGS